MCCFYLCYKFIFIMFFKFLFIIERIFFLEDVDILDGGGLVEMLLFIFKELDDGLSFWDLLNFLELLSNIKILSFMYIFFFILMEYFELIMVNILIDSFLIVYKDNGFLVLINLKF